MYTEELRGIIIHETTLCVMKHSGLQNVRQTVRLEEKDVDRDMYGFAACMSRWKTANIEKRRTFGGTWQHSKMPVWCTGGTNDFICSLS